MIDSHFHADLYPDPSQVIRDALRAGVGVVVVTNLPSAYDRAFPFIGKTHGVRLALGLHPLVADQHEHERPRFGELIKETRYVGEVGLDFSSHGIATRDMQEESFRFVLRCMSSDPRFVSVHSRKAESRLLKMLEEEAYAHPIVFHWYTGALGALDAAVADGHYFSVNPAMMASTSGMKIVSRIPRDRVLTETDGPFVRVGRRTALPGDVIKVIDGLARIWNIAPSEAKAIVNSNFRNLRSKLGGLGEQE